MFAETRPEAIEDMRQAADELRAELAGELVTFVVNRNINISNVCTVGCAFCGFGQGKRSPDAYEHDEQRVRRRASTTRVEYGATELCIQSGIHPDWELEDYLGWLRLAKDRSRRGRRAAPARLQPDGDRAHVRHLGPAARGGLRAAARRGPRLDAGHGRRGAARRRARADLAEQAPGGALGARSSRPRHEAGLRSTATVMFGHIEEPWELAEHMRVVRELQERTGGITEFVPLSFIPFQTLLGRTHGVEEISREENLKHTAVFRLALGRTVPSLQASWVKMGLDAATEALRWGVNDLGGTLMEESISRLAGSYHGTRLDPDQLSRPRTRPAVRRPSARRSTRSGASSRWPRRRPRTRCRWPCSAVRRRPRTALVHGLFPDGCRTDKRT